MSSERICADYLEDILDALSKVHIQGVVFFQERGHTCSMPNVCKNTTTQ